MKKRIISVILALAIACAFFSAVSENHRSASALSAEPGDFYIALFDYVRDLERIVSINGVILRFHGKIDSINTNDLTAVVLTRDGAAVTNALTFSGVVEHGIWWSADHVWGADVTDFYFVFAQENTQQGVYDLTGRYRGQNFTTGSRTIEGPVGSAPADPNALISVGWVACGITYAISQTAFRFSGTQQSFYRSDLTNLRLLRDGQEIAFSLTSEVNRQLDSYADDTFTTFYLTFEGDELNIPGTYRLAGTYRGVPFSSEEHKIPVPPISVVLDGRQLTFDVPPQSTNDRIVLPLRAIFEAMGASVVWDGGAQTATATKGDTVVVMTIGCTSPTVNGRVVTIDQPGIVINGRLLAPLRFVAEAFGGTVDWNGATQTAIITSQ